MKRLPILLVFLSIFSFQTLWSQQHVWSKSFGGSLDEHAYAITTDNQGNIYIGGSFKSWGIYPQGIQVDSLLCQGESDAFIQKRDSSGSVLWTRGWGGGDVDYIFDIAIDSQGNVYTAGTFSSDSVDFDPSGATHYKSNQGYSDGFLHKLDKDGNFHWVKTYSTTSSDKVTSLAIKDSSLFVVGQRGPSVFLEKLDLDGLFDWDTKNFASPVGLSTRMGLNPNDQLVVSSGGSGNMKVTGIDTSGTNLWQRTSTSTESLIAENMAIDREGNIYLTGNFGGTTQFNINGTGQSVTTATFLEDIFILKLDSQGIFEWVITYTTIPYQEKAGLALATDSMGNVYAGGFIRGSTNVNPSGTHFLETNGLSDIYIVKLNSYGHLLWGLSTGGPQFETIFDLTLNNQEEILFCGNFQGKSDLDPGLGYQPLNSNGGFDAFVCKWDQTTPTVSLPTIANPWSLSAFPNPTTESVTVKTETTQNNVTLTLVDASGKVIWSEFCSEFTEREIEINSNPGTYFLTLSSPTHSKTIPLVKKSK
ncbi:MAG: hypothetical protein SchgKO_23470 [Schleiferiaceae bacterium]